MIFPKLKFTYLRKKLATFEILVVRGFSAYEWIHRSPIYTMEIKKIENGKWPTLIFNKNDICKCDRRRLFVNKIFFSTLTFENLCLVEKISTLRTFWKKRDYRMSFAAPVMNRQTGRDIIIIQGRNFAYLRKTFVTLGIMLVWGCSAYQWIRRSPIYTIPIFILLSILILSKMGTVDVTVAGF